MASTPGTKTIPTGSRSMSSRNPLRMSCIRKQRRVEWCACPSGCWCYRREQKALRMLPVGWRSTETCGIVILTTMTQPATKANELSDRWGLRVNDHSVAFELFEARLLVRECRDAMKAADSSGKCTLFGLMGAAYFRVSKYSDALDALNNAEKYEPGRTGVATTRGACLIELGRFREACECLENNLKRLGSSGPDTIICLVNLVEAQWLSGDKLAARQTMLKAIRLAEHPDENVLFLLALQHAVIGANNDATEFLARLLAAEAKQERGNESSVALIQRLAPDWRQRFAHAPKIVAAVERVMESDAVEARSPELSTWGATDPLAMKALFDLPDSPPKRIDEVINRTPAQ